MTFPVVYNEGMSTKHNHGGQDMDTIDIEITLNRRTETVTFRHAANNRYYSDSIFAGRIAQGGKFHRCWARAYIYSSRDEITTKSGRKQAVDLADGRVAVLDLSDTVRGRYCAISQWADDVEGTRNAAQGNAYNSLAR